MAQINRGSEWRKWDLHVHTPASFYWTGTKKYKEMSREEVVTEIKKFIEIVNKSDIAVFCLMDYWTFDWYLELQEYLISNPDELKKTVLPGMELRVESPTNYRLNVHFILSDKLTKQQLIDFKSELYIRSINKKLSDDSLIQFAKSLDVSKAKHHSFDDPNVLSEEQLLQLGSQTAEITKESLHEAFKQIPETSGFVFLPYDTSDGLLKLNWKNHPHADNYFMQTADIFESRDQTNIDLICGKLTEENSPFFENFYKTLGNKSKPCVAGSDAHKYSDYGKFPSNKATWIKAQPTFEGLKQIIYEPEERVKIQNEMPESEKLDNLMIEKVTFTSSENRFTPEPIYFNKNLNVIIGGKSSGKSILLYEIAKTLYADSSDEVLQYKDVTDGNIKDLYNLNEISKDKKDETYNFKVDLFSESSQNLKDRSSNSSILPSIKYIPQNHLSNLVDRSRKNGGTLKKLIRNLILEEDEYQLKYDEFVKQAKRNDEQREKDIDYYFTLENELTKKEAELQTKGDTKALKEGIEHNKHKIAQLNKDFSENEQTEYTAFVEKLNAIKIQENNINSDYEKLDGFQSELKRTLIELANKKKIVLDTLQNERIKNEFTSKLQFLDDAVLSINEISTEFGKTEENKYIPTSLFTSTLKTILEDKEKIEQDLKPFNDKLENQKQVSAIQKSISEDEAKVAAIEQFIKEIKTSKAAIITQKEKLFADFETNYQLYDKIIEDLKPRISNLQSGTDKIEIKPSVKYNFPKFRRLADNLFDNRGFNNNGFKYIYQNHSENPKSALSDVEISLVIQDLKEIFDKIVNNQLTPKGGNDKKSAIKKIFTDFFFDHWDVNSQDDDIHKMSTGKASFILLKLIIKLSKDNGPILIDQPEDNLDNRSVSKELVDFLKDKKRERQIILVTHNPNIVVNADAENIIVANQKGQNDIASTSDYKFDYINGALEDSFAKNFSTDLLKSMGIREHIAEIVEGGKEAFKKREEKYGFN